MVSVGLGGGLAVLSMFAAGEWSARRGFRRAEAFWEQGDYRRAGEQFQQMAQDHPRHSLAPEALFRVGRINYIFLRNASEAVHVLRIVAKDPMAGPWAARAQRLLGEIFELRQEDYRQAIVDYQRFISVNSGGEGNDEAQFAVARCYFKLEDFEQARGEYEVLLERYPDSALRVRALEGIANAYYVTGRYELAAKTYRQIMVEAEDGNVEAEACFGVASSLEMSGDLTGALLEFEKIRESYPNAGLVSERITRVRSRLELQGHRSAAFPEGRK